MYLKVGSIDRSSNIVAAFIRSIVLNLNPNQTQTSLT
jgi:hypothetical protein